MIRNCLYMVKETSVSCEKSKYIIPRWLRRASLTSFKRTRQIKLPLDLFVLMLQLESTLTSFPHDNCVCLIIVQLYNIYKLISVGILRHFASQSRYHLLCVIFQTFRPKRKLEEGTLRYELHKQSKVPFIKHGNQIHSAIHISYS